MKHSKETRLRETPLKEKQKTAQNPHKKKKKRKFFVLAILFLVPFWFFDSFSSETRIRKAISEERYEEALQEIEKLLEKDSKNLSALQMRGKIYYLLSRKEDLLEPKSSATIQKAIFSLEESIAQQYAQSKNPAKKELHSPSILADKKFFYLAYCSFLLGKDHYNKALVYLEKYIDQLETIQEQPHSVVFQVYGKKHEGSLKEWLAYMAYHSQEYEKAIVSLKKALVQKEQSKKEQSKEEKNKEKKNEAEKKEKAILQFYLALSYIQQNQLSKAKKELFSILLLFRELQDPEIQDAQDTQDGEKDTEKNYVPWLEKVYLSLSEIYFQEKKFKESLEWMKKIQNLHASAKNLYSLGLIYEALKENQNAVKSWKQALELDPYQDRIRQKYIRYLQKQDGSF